MIVIASSNSCAAWFAAQAQEIEDRPIAWGTQLPVSESTWTEYYKRRVPEEQEPWWVHRDQSQDSFSGYLWVDRNLPYFAGHFPGDPILPGVVQLNWTLAAVAETFPAMGMRDFKGMAQVKFKARVTPASWLQLELKVQGSEVRCRLANAAGICTEARLRYRESST